MEVRKKKLRLWKKKGQELKFSYEAKDVDLKTKDWISVLASVPFTVLKGCLIVNTTFEKLGLGEGRAERLLSAP